MCSFRNNYEEILKRGKNKKNTGILQIKTEFDANERVNSDIRAIKGKKILQEKMYVG